MYENAYHKLTAAGYVNWDGPLFKTRRMIFQLHFQKKKLHRNLQGYCTRATTGQVYGFGASSYISQLDSAYAQNIKNASSYIENIEKKGLAIFRGYSLNKNEKRLSGML